MSIYVSIFMYINIDKFLFGQNLVNIEYAIGFML